MGIFSDISIRFKIPLFLILVVLIIFSLAGYFSLKHVFSITEESYKRELLSIAQLVHQSYTRTGDLPIENISVNYSVYLLKEEEEGFLKIVKTYNAEPTDLEDYLFQFNLEGKEKVGIFPSDDLLRVFKTPLGSYLRAGNSMVIITMPGKMLTRLESSIRRDFILLYFLGILLALITSIIFANALTKRLKKITITATDLSLGRLEKRVVPIGSDEVGELGQIVNSFADEALVINREKEEYHKVVQKMEFPIALILRDGSLLTTNQVFQKLFGKEKGKFHEIVEGVEELHQSKLSIVIKEKTEQSWMDKGLNFHLLPLDEVAERFLCYGVPQASAESDMGVLGISSVKLQEKLDSFIKIIKASTKTIATSEYAPEISGEIENIEDSLEKINDTLALLKEYAEPIYPSLEPIGIKAVVDELIKELPEGDRLKMTVEVDPSLKIFATFQLLKRAITLLLDNALYAIKRGGEIFIRTEAKEEEVVITVANTGQGMKEKIVANAFQPFFSGWGRPGLGLSLAKKLVESQGGKIKLSSTEGGTQVTMTFKKASK